MAQQCERDKKQSEQPGHFASPKPSPLAPHTHSLENAIPTTVSTIASKLFLNAPRFSLRVLFLSEENG